MQRAWGYGKALLQGTIFSQRVILAYFLISAMSIAYNLLKAGI